MKTILTIFFTVLTFLQLSAKEFPGFYVNLKGDTIQCKFKVQVNLFKKDMLNQLSFRKKIKIITNGSSIKYKPNEIKMFQIDSTSEGSERYVPLEVESKLWFVRVVEEGKVNLYEFFYPHGYDGSVMMKYVVHTSDKLPMAIPAAFWRKKLLKYFENDEWLEKEINQDKIKYSNIPELIMTYNLE